MLPTEAAKKHAEMLQAYSPLVQQQVAFLTRKLLVLSFPAQFTRLVEGPVVNTFYFKPLGDGKFSSVLNKEEEIAGTLSVESVRIERALGEIAIAVPRADRQII